MKYQSIPELADLAVGETTPEKFEGWLNEGRVYLVEEDHMPLGLLATSVRDGMVYINEIAVHAESQGQGIGALLLAAAFEWAEGMFEAGEIESARVSLTTYTEGVSWNAPWYRKHGFKEVEADTVGRWHIYKMKYDKEERTLDRPGFRRCCMLWDSSER